MEGLKFPKQQKKKKRKKHKQSIIPGGNSQYCFLCDARAVHEHHVFGGPNRTHSEEYGLKVNLCLAHHTSGPEAVHNNPETARKLHEIGQQAFEENHEREEFIKIFGRNYLGTI